jgi:hypothetical protein
VYVTVVGADVESMVADGVAASTWTDHFMTEGNSEGDDTVLASDSNIISSEGGTADVSLSVTSYCQFSFQLSR